MKLYLVEIIGSDEYEFHSRVFGVFESDEFAENAILNNAITMQNNKEQQELIDIQRKKALEDKDLPLYTKLSKKYNAYEISDNDELYPENYRITPIETNEIIT